MTKDAPFQTRRLVPLLQGKRIPAGRAATTTSAWKALRKKPAKLLTPEEMGGILLRGKDLLKWYSDVEDEALEPAA